MTRAWAGLVGAALVYYAILYLIMSGLPVLTPP